MQGFFEKFLNRFLVFEKPKNKHFQGVWGAVPIHATLRSRFSAPLFARLPRGRKKFFLNILWLPVQPAVRNPKMLLSPCFRQLLHPNCSCFPTVLATRLFLRPGCSCDPAVLAFQIPFRSCLNYQQCFTIQGHLSPKNQITSIYETYRPLLSQIFSTIDFRETKTPSSYMTSCYLSQLF